MQDSTVAILGLGLMGGSLAMALRGHCRRLVASDPDPAALAAARRQQVVDEADSNPEHVVRGAHVVILAAPVPAILRLLDALPCWTPDPCIVSDIGSSKAAIVEAMARLPERFEPIGGHPLCGKEKLSLANAEAGLYQGIPFLLTPLERTTARALSAANQIIDAIGARTVVLEAAAHDRMLASTSHMPYLLSSALALAMPGECASLAGPGFRSTSRLAGTPSAMMLGVLETNRENVLTALHALQHQLDRLEHALASENFPELEALLNAALAKYRGLIK